MNIDTSTTAGKITVMQAAEFGLAIESMYISQRWMPNNEPRWNWHCDYRIAPGQDAKLADFERFHKELDDYKAALLSAYQTQTP